MRTPEEILKITDEEISKMDYKEKQQYFKDRNKICRVIYKQEPNKPGKTYINYKKRFERYKKMQKAQGDK